MSVQIITGDCIESMRLLPDKSVQACITSPPYWGLRDYGHDGQIGLEESPKVYVDKMMCVFNEVHRLLKDDGVLWLNLGDSYCSQGGKHDGRTDNQPNVGAKRVWRDGAGRADGVVDERGQRNRNGNSVGGLAAKNLIGIPWRVAFALQDVGWILRQDIIWHKPNPMPESVMDRCTKSHEYIFMLTKSAKYYFDSEAMREPVAASQVGRVRADKFGGNKYDVVNHSPGSIYVKGRGGKNAFRGQGHFREGENGPANREGRDMTDVGASETRNRRSVWTVATAPFKGAHFATFPPKLIEPCVLASTKPGDTILDPFGGSGTTGMVAQQHGRSAILCELNPEYAAMASARCGIVVEEVWS